MGLALVTRVVKFLRKGEQGPSVGTNLLDGSAFVTNISKWELHVGTLLNDGACAQKSLYYANYYGSDYVDMLKQVIYSSSKKSVSDGQWYTLSFWCKGNGTVNTYLYPGIVDYAAGMYIDGSFASSVGSDGEATWTLGGTWSKHTVTFKTLVTPSTESHYVLWRVPKGSGAYISAAKLELGNDATDWCASESDKAGESSVWVDASSLVRTINISGDGTLKDTTEIHDTFKLMYGSKVCTVSSISLDGVSTTSSVDGKIGASDVTLENRSSYADMYIDYSGDKTVDSKTFTIGITGSYGDIPCHYEFKYNVIVHRDGSKGEKGAGMRGPQGWSDLDVGYQFLSGAEGESYYDVVVYGTAVAVCKKSHVKTADNYPGSTLDTNNGYWSLTTVQEVVATKLFLAELAYIKNLGAEALYMKDANGNVAFRAANGDVECNTGTFKNILLKGSSRSPFTYPLSGSNEALSDNVAMSSNMFTPNVYALQWDISQNGRSITLSNYMYSYNGQTGVTSGGVTITAPSGQYFYEDGIAKTSLFISREFVELKGYGCETTFFGWIVMKRGNLSTQYTYGREKRMLMYGRVTTSKSSRGVISTSISATTYDAATDYSVTRDAVGKYTVKLPTSYKFYQYEDVMVNAIGLGHSLEDTTLEDGTAQYSPLKVSVGSITSYNGAIYITFYTSDDNSVNDGSFMFEISNVGDFRHYAI